MAEKPKLGYKSKIYYEAGVLGSGTWIALKKVDKITPPKKTNRKVKVTDLDSPDWTDEFIPGFGEYSAAKWEGNYLAGDADHEQMLDDMDAGTQRNFKIEIIDPVTGAVDKTITWLGHIEDGGINILEVETQRRWDGSINVDGSYSRT
jgi:hypothetical protein